MPIRDIIIQLFLGKDPGPLQPQDWASIIRVLRYQQCLARLGWRLRDKGLLATLPDYVLNHLKNAELIAQKQYHQVQYEAKLLNRLLKPLTTNLLFLKGAAYSLTEHANVGLGRTYSDIDLLVDRPSLLRIEQELCLYGFFAEDLDEYDQKYYREWSHEIPPLRHGNRGTLLDVHHNLLPLMTGRAPDIQLFFRHTQQTSAGYFVFSPAAMLLHSAIHLLLSEEIKHGFRDLTDLYLILEQYQSPDFWQELLLLATQSGFASELFLALRYNQKILAFDVPPQVWQQLEPYQPGKFQQRCLDFIFMRKLQPAHPISATSADAIADFLLLLRGHYLKMPLWLLLKHLSRKFSRQMLSAVFGSNIFDKKTDQSSQK
ncbi:nucleotidyltransferase family protein [Rheinheimera sp.]|uniref:nucleotidyltransferase domain-containing protein n=1 Tax=Rheinheimera sp. TaxID=1869214 RepID=UPI0027B90164|nr:nucleotidyltransferase family protein [Rheinheimera sp.]